MAYRRGGFALTPPSMLVFVISAVLGILALLIRYAGISIPALNPHTFSMLAIAFVLLVAGVVFPRL